MNSLHKIRIWSACLIAWMLGCAVTASAQSTYDALCAGSNASQEHTIAWLEIVDADFCQPIMRNADDDSFYASHDASGAESELGALYVQAAYNADDFSDPVTIAYGSSRTPGAPLRDLQELYSGRFDECRKILLHLPEESLEYEVFAAIPYSSLHILHYYDFTSERRYKNFFDAVYSTRALGMHLAESDRPEYGEQVLIVSTGLRGDPMQRYLVMAKPASGAADNP